MTSDDYWFRPKRYGFGATPVTWQGWALVFAFVAIVCAVVVCFQERPALIVSMIAPLLLIFLFITVKMTRGGWRWRWGEDE